MYAMLATGFPSGQDSVSHISMYNFPLISPRDG